MSFVSPRPREQLRVEGKQKSLFPEGTIIKCFGILPDSKIEKNGKQKMISLKPTVAVPAVRAAVETKLSYRNDTIIVFFRGFTANKK